MRPSPSQTDSHLRLPHPRPLGDAAGPERRDAQAAEDVQALGAVVHAVRGDVGEDGGPGKAGKAEIVCLVGRRTCVRRFAATQGGALFPPGCGESLHARVAAKRGRVSSARRTNAGPGEATPGPKSVQMGDRRSSARIVKVFATRSFPRLVVHGEELAVTSDAGRSRPERPGSSSIRQR